MSDGESAGVAGLGQLPSFTLPSAAGGEVRSWSYRGRRNLVVWFAGASPDPVAVREAAERRSEVQAEDGELLIVVRASPAAARALRERAGADAPLLADEDGEFQRAAEVATPTLFVTDRSRQIYWRAPAVGRPPLTDAISWLAYLNILEPECGTCVPAWPPELLAAPDRR